eukprot:3644258-Pleurochrysis_carterae.AAC.2
MLRFGRMCAAQSLLVVAAVQTRPFCLSDKWRSAAATDYAGSCTNLNQSDSYCRASSQTTWHLPKPWRGSTSVVGDAKLRPRRRACRARRPRRRPAQVSPARFRALVSAALRTSVRVLLQNHDGIDGVISIFMKKTYQYDKTHPSQ